METKKHPPESTTPRSKVWTSLVTTTLGAIASLISAIVASADIFNVSKKWGAAVAVAVATVALSAVITSFLARRERGPSRIAKLKDEFANAYLGALESSPLNPLRGGQR